MERAWHWRAFFRLGAGAAISALGGLVLAVVTAPAPLYAETTSPNVLLIMADDLGWRDVGYHGSEIRTPHIDRMAEAGLVLERFYVQPICSPTRAAVMTGKSPARLGIYRPISKVDSKGLPLEETILPEFFLKAGYQTAIIGKWHLGHSEKRYFPLARGFEHFHGNLTGGIGYWDHNHGGGHDWQRNGVTLREKGYVTRLTADAALEWIGARDPSRPFFLVASFNAPHLPNEAPEETLALYPEAMSPLRKIHAAMVSELDTAVGRILAKLEAEGLREDTLVWFFSDNGGLNPSASPPGLVRVVDGLVDVFGEPIPIEFLEFARQQIHEGASDNAPLRGGKASVYEGGIRVPSVISWPGRVTPGESNAFVTAEDVLPTLLEAVGLARWIPQSLDGSERWEAIRDEEVPFPDLESPRAFRVEGIGSVGLVRPPWKLVLEGPPLPFGGPEPALYNIAEDEGEKENLAQQFPDVTAALRAELDSWPAAPSVHRSLFWTFIDPDRFGGDEDRMPWAEAAR